MTLPQDVEDVEDGPHRPDYPPKTPPPPKKPVEAPRPETRYGPRHAAAAPGSSCSGGPGSAVDTQPRLRARIANRRAANWTLDAQPWAAKSAGSKAARNVGDKLTGWGYRPVPARHASDLTQRLVDAAIGDGGARISVHLADQDQQALILVLSHQPTQDTPDQQLLHNLASMGVVSCGVDTDRDGAGRRRWALIDL
ncbi:hypothetical protein [Streptomyces lavendofoliae]|uniref:hypothetical protein n=1 Tax=Streptomyces lavendofoliae TaxID=67314 RepID=UPI003D90E162